MASRPAGLTGAGGVLATEGSASFVDAARGPAGPGVSGLVMMKTSQNAECSSAARTPLAVTRGSRPEPSSVGQFVSQQAIHDAAMVLRR